MRFLVKQKQLHQVSILTIVCLVGVIACQSSTQVSRQQVQQELKTRADNRRRATEFYEKSLDKYRSGKLDEAAQNLSKATSLDADHAQAWIVLGIVENERGRLFEAAQAFDKASKLAPTRYEPYYNLGIVLETAGQYSGAIKSYETALERAPTELQIKENLARCLVSAKVRLPRAKQLIDESLEQELRPEWRSWLLRQSAFLNPSPAAAPAME